LTCTVLPSNKALFLAPVVDVTNKSFTTQTGLAKVQELELLTPDVRKDKLLKLTPVVLVVLADVDGFPFISTV
jgi:hypothetical protein